MIYRTRNPFTWLMMLLTAWVLLAGNALNAKTVSGVSHSVERHVRGLSLLEALSCQGFEGCATIAVSGVLVAADSAVAAGTRYGPLLSGPLDAATAATFRGGSYTATTVEESTTLYRVYGGNAGQLGPYWTRVQPSGPLQSQLDSALLSQWGNTASNVVSIRVPTGTTIYEGFAAPQATGAGQLLGGGSQIYIPRVDPKWIQ